MKPFDIVIVLVCCFLGDYFLARAYGYLKDIRTARRLLKEKYERMLLEAKWSKPTVWDVRVKGNVCSFLTMESSYYCPIPWSREAVLTAVSNWRHDDAARIMAALGYNGVRPRMANEYALPKGRTDRAQEWYFPLPEMFDSSRHINGWFYVRGQPNWDVKVKAREGGVTLPEEKK